MSQQLLNETRETLKEVMKVMKADHLHQGTPGRLSLWTRLIDLRKRIEASAEAENEKRLQAIGYDLEELERDNPYNAWMTEDGSI